MMQVMCAHTLDKLSPIAISFFLFLVLLVHPCHAPSRHRVRIRHGPRTSKYFPLLTIFFTAPGFSELSLNTGLQIAFNHTSETCAGSAALSVP